MRRSALLLSLCVLASFHADARKQAGICGTYRGRVQDELALHRNNLQLRRAAAAGKLLSGARKADVGGEPRPARPDSGDIAVIEAADGVISLFNDFDLNQRTVTFTPAGSEASSYRFAVSAGSYDAAAAGNGQKLDGLADDDARLLTLPFSFPFYGRRYSQVYVNSDGNLTFNEFDIDTSDRSLGRLNIGPPRIAPLFADLDPSASNSGVRVFSSATQVVISWIAVPEWTQLGPVGANTFQVRLYPDGKVEFAWMGTQPEESAVVGIAPGNLLGASSVVTFTDGSSQTYGSTVAEAFGGDGEFDYIIIGQKFYENHEDAYDYLILFNAVPKEGYVGTPDSDSSLASTRVIRNNFSGNGDVQLDFGRWFGSPSRLQAVIHMAFPLQYPDDLDAKLGFLGRGTDSSIGVLAHEVGHLFLAYASNVDANRPNDLPMLGYGNSHWSFNFNSEASLLEGNTIQDSGAGISPRFKTVKATEVYSPLDQYLMGFRAPEEVMPNHSMFYVSGSQYPDTWHPRLDVSFNGARRDVHIDEVIAANGRRTPDHTVAQRRFRLGFALIVPKGEQPQQRDLDIINRFRQKVEPYYANAASNRAFIETTLKREMKLSVFPGAGVLKGKTVTAGITLKTAPESPLTVTLQRNSGVTSAPASVAFAAGQKSATFSVEGLRAGVEALTATPSDPRYETVYASVQVLDSVTQLRLAVVSGDDQLVQGAQQLANPVVFRVVDTNNLPYPGVSVQAQVSAGGTLAQASLVSDASGLVRFVWTPSTNAFNELKAGIEGVAASSTTVYAWSNPSFTAEGVVNGASFTRELAPGMLASLFGVNLATGAAAAASLPLPYELGDVELTINGVPAPLLYVSPLQINFLVPSGVAVGTATVRVHNLIGNSASIPVTISALAPAIFNDPAANVGAILVSGQGQKTNVRPARPNEYLEIYATGLGAVQISGGLYLTVEPVKVYINNQLSPDVPYSGLASGFVGLYQVNAKVPAGLAPGRYPVVLEAGGKRSNEVFIQVQ